MGGFNDFFANQAAEETDREAAPRGPESESFSPGRQSAPAASKPVPSPFSTPSAASAQQPAASTVRQAPAPRRAAVAPASNAAASTSTQVLESAPVPVSPQAAPAPESAQVLATRTSTLPATTSTLAPAKELSVVSVERKSTTGWRAFLNRFGLSFGLSTDEVRFEELWKQSRQRIGGTWYVPVIGSGGVTTITMGLGSTFAELRGEKVLAIDADPGFGDLVDRAELERSDERGYTVTDILGDPDISTYSDCRAYTVMNVSDLEVLAADVTAGREEFTGAHLSGLLRTIAGHYQLVFSDHGRNIRDSVGAAAFERACGLVIVCGTTLNDTKAVDRQIAQLRATGYEQLLKRSVLVINQLHGHKPRVSVSEIQARYSSTVASIQVVGFDPHLSQGGPIRTDLVAAPIRRSFVELAAKTGLLIDSKSRGIR